MSLGSSVFSADVSEMMIELVNEYVRVIEILLA